MNGIIGALREVDQGHKEALKETVKLLFEITRANRRKHGSRHEAAERS